MTDAFDADAIIYAAVPDHPLGRRVLALFLAAGQQRAGAGSVLLLPEILSRPLRIARWAGSAHRQHHPLAWLPLELSGLEVARTLPSYHSRGGSYTAPYGPSGEPARYNVRGTGTFRIAQC